MYHQKTLALDNKNVAIETTVRDATEEFNDYCEGDSKNMIIPIGIERILEESQCQLLTCPACPSIIGNTRILSMYLLVHTFYIVLTGKSKYTIITASFLNFF